MCVRDTERLLFLPYVLLGKFLVNIWVLRNINCDGSHQCLNIISGFDRYFFQHQVEPIWTLDPLCTDSKNTVRKKNNNKKKKNPNSPWRASQALTETLL